MATPKWQAGHLYPPGSLVQPQTALPPTGYALTNPGFESGSTDWTLGTGMATDTANPFAGTTALRCTGTAGLAEVVHDEVPVSPGTSITASCMYQQGGASSGQNVGQVFLRWYTAAMALISDSDGVLVTSTTGNSYKQSTVTAVAPAGAAFVAIGGKTNRTSSDDSRFDNFAWSYGAYIVPSGLIYKAVQAATGYSGSDEPTWPLVLGVQVIDNEVTWEAVLANRVIWEASPIMLSGATEPTWPTEVGEFVSDNTVSWEVISRRVEDEKCPNSKVVAILAGKVFAADGDIVRFSATANPLDWSSADDAGYLPTGLQQANANDMAVLNQYRSNLIGLNASSFQNWQADPDPAQMALLDQMDGIGSVWQQAAQPVANELFYLSQLGVRTVGIAAGAENLSAGDVGAPIDVLVQAAIVQSIIDGTTPRSTYYPGAGQYWLAFPPPSVPTGPIVITGEFADATIGVEYSGGPLVAAGAFPPLRWEITALPAGLSMDINSSLVTGTPTATGTVTGDVTVTDRYGRTATAERSINVIFSSNIAVYTGEEFREYSGETSGYNFLQSLTVPAGGIEISVSDGGNFVAAIRTGIPYFILLKRNEFGSYGEVASPLDIELTTANDTHVSLTADASYLAITQGTAQWVYKRSGDTFTRIANIAMADIAGACKFSPSGSHLANRGATNQSIAVFSRADDIFTALTGTFGTESNTRDIAWSLDGTKLACVRNGGVYVVSVGDSLTVAATVAASIGNGSIRWGRDGGYIFAGSLTADAGVTLRAFQWGGASIITPLSTPAHQPAEVERLSLSADGRVLAAVSNTEMFLYEASEGALTRIVPVAAITGSPPIGDFMSSSDHWS